MAIYYETEIYKHIHFLSTIYTHVYTMHIIFVGKFVSLTFVISNLAIFGYKFDISVIGLLYMYGKLISLSIHKLTVHVLYNRNIEFVVKNY